MRTGGALGAGQAHLSSNVLPTGRAGGPAQRLAGRHRQRHPDAGPAQAGQGPGQMPGHGPLADPARGDDRAGHDRPGPPPQPPGQGLHRHTPRRGHTSAHTTLSPGPGPDPDGGGLPVARRGPRPGRDRAGDGQTFWPGERGPVAGPRRVDRDGLDFGEQRARVPLYWGHGAARTQRASAQSASSHGPHGQRGSGTGLLPPRPGPLPHPTGGRCPSCPDPKPYPPRRKSRCCPALHLLPGHPRPSQHQQSAKPVQRQPVSQRQLDSRQRTGLPPAARRGTRT